MLLFGERGLRSVVCCTHGLLEEVALLCALLSPMVQSCCSLQIELVQLVVAEEVAAFLTLCADGVIVGTRLDVSWEINVSSGF